MLAFALKYADNARMSKKRVTLTDNSRNQPHEAKVSQGVFKKRGKEYVCYRVQGWKEDGKWQKKQFSKESDAIEFARQKNIELLNHGRKIVLVASELDQEQTREAEAAIKALGDIYSLNEAVQFFLKHHRPPEFTISITDGVDIYLAEKKREGVRETTTETSAKIIRAFARHSGNPLVHTVTKSSVTTFLKTLRAKDKTSPAKKKTWNNYRNELASFFIWAGSEDLSTNRPWTFNNPTEGVHAFSTKRVAEERPAIATTSPEATRELLSYVMSYKGGKLAKWFALAYFAGIRPSTNNGELAKLSAREDELINLTTGRIMIPSDVAKTKHSRQIRIGDNLKAWLEAYKDFPIIPTNLKHDYAEIRKKFKLQQDETRHSFISYHVALNRSVGDTALEAGNSESMIKKHYLNHHSQEEGSDFFSIVPDMATGEAVYSEKAIETPQNLKAI